MNILYGTCNEAADFITLLMASPGITTSGLEPVPNRAYSISIPSVQTVCTIFSLIT